MKVSVVIVNYNVKHFLDQCLVSVYDSERGGVIDDIEVFVVDNNSDDGSVEMLREKFPSVRLITNKDNVGFAKANNQAIRECSGDYVLLLNPDTLLQTDTLLRCVEHFEANERCGGLTVKMVNGEGEYLKESKRGFPTPATSFYKISGLIRLFPRHRRVAAYYMGHLSDDEEAPVDILPGAFLMIRRAALDKVGLLDESYFMYGEDIDYSWRIKLAGFENHYMPTTRILHYKGESTHRGSMNYVYTFYNAMVIFARRYFSGRGARLYMMLIQTAIWCRAFLAFMQRLVGRLALPTLDFAVSWGGFVAIKYLWASLWASNVNYYPQSYTFLILPLYSLLLLCSTFLGGGYDKPVRTGRIAKGIALGTCLLLLFYSLLDETLRYSRAIVLLGSLRTLAGLVAVRLLLGLFRVKGYAAAPRRRRYLVVGSPEEQARVAALFDTMDLTPHSVDTCLPSQVDSLIGSTAKTGHIDEMVFCSKDLSVDRILDTMCVLRGKGITFRIAPHGDSVLIGSKYTATADSLYGEASNTVTSATNRRNKRLFDILTAIAMLLLSPLLFWPQQHKRRYFADCLSVLRGRSSWVGYSTPNIRAGVFSTSDRFPKAKGLDRQRLDHNYTSDYHTSTDLIILLRNWNRI